MEIDQALIDEAIDNIDEILNEHAVGYVQLDRAALIERMEKIRDSAKAARYVLVERRHSLRLE